jgi:iron complex outermembrane receptor protein
MMKKFFSGLVFALMPLIFPTCLFAQITDTMFVLPEFNVKETRMHYFNAGSAVSRIDTTYIQLNPAASLGDILLNNSSLHVDAYGVGSTTVSARGLGAKRTPVIWNGFNLQSISGHDVDIATIQGFMVDNIQIETGSSSALFGSGAAGGIVYIDNKPIIGTPNQTQVGVSMGSYGRYMGGSSVRWGSGNYKGTLRLFYEAADNDFDYTADYLNTKTQAVTHVDTNQVNAARHQFGLMSDNVIQINQYQQLQFHLWFQDVNREIAPTVKDVVGKKVADALQIDQNYRGSAQWDYQKGIWKTAIRSALLTSQTHYTKPSTTEDTKTKGNSWISEAEASCIPMQYLSVNMGVHYTYEDSHSSSYDQWHERNRAAAFASTRINFEPTGSRITINGRLEHIEMEKFPFTWTIGLDQTLIGPLSLVAKAGTSYRVPSFNDLYWDSSYAVGNPDLKPEEGTNYEAGLQWKSTHGLLNLEAGASAFVMDMKNWMSWGPREDGMYTVLNQDSAKIEGLETQASLTMGTAQHNISLRGAYSYLDARDPKTDNRLTYVPMHKGSLSLSATSHGFTMMTSRTESSKMATDAKNTNYLRGYITYDCGLYKNLALPSAEINVGLKVQNLTDQQYQTRLYYPMPGRQYLLSVAVKLM